MDELLYMGRQSRVMTPRRHVSHLIYSMGLILRLEYPHFPLSEYISQQVNKCVRVRVSE